MQTTLCRMTSNDFHRLSQFISAHCGIKMPEVKKLMLESRLQKRLNNLEINSFKEYCDFLFSKEGMRTELIQMVDVVTTNKTDFFREQAHFDFLSNHLLPEWTRNENHARPLRIWSAGCSSGEEAYTTAMTISEFISAQPVDFSILGTDISTQILNKAINAVYGEDRIAGIPLALKRKYFLKSKDPQNKTVRIVPELRSKANFMRLNFMDDNYQVPYEFDIIFCRNVLIYFDRPTQEKVINGLCQKLKKGGCFFLGHSESITDMKVPLMQVRPTIFRRI